MHGTATVMKAGEFDPAKGKFDLNIRIPKDISEAEELAPGWIVEFEMKRTKVYRKPKSREEPKPKATPQAESVAPTQPPTEVQP